MNEWLLANAIDEKRWAKTTYTPELWWKRKRDRLNNIKINKFDQIIPPI